MCLAMAWRVHPTYFFDKSPIIVNTAAAIAEKALTPKD